jgi:Ca2+-binding RTX toxin-like protein
VTGANLTYDSSQEPSGGTYNAIAIFSDPDFQPAHQVASFSSDSDLDFSSLFDFGSGAAVAALAGADTITGSNQDDFIGGRGGADTMDGKGGSDRYLFAKGDVVSGEIINDTGATGFDRLIVSDTSVDFRPGTFNHIEGMAFGFLVDAVAFFNASQFGGIHIVSNFSVRGNTGNQNIFVLNATKFSAANWTFSDWNGGDHLVITGTSGNNTISGSKLADVLRGMAGNDTLSGGAGKDVLTGGAGCDTMTGGTNRDLFDFNAISETKKGPNHDKITDFHHGTNVTGDDIDLRTIDAKTGVEGNQPFHFIGKHDFHHVKGELHIVTSGANVLVQGDVNGDAKADFEILVLHHTSIAEGDFLL